jgi:hypothetical protein
MTRVSIDNFEQWMIFTDSKTIILNNQILRPDRNLSSRSHLCS